VVLTDSSAFFRKQGFQSISEWQCQCRFLRRQEHTLSGVGGDALGFEDAGEIEIKFESGGGVHARVRKEAGVVGTGGRKAQQPAHAGLRSLLETPCLRGRSARANCSACLCYGSFPALLSNAHMPFGPHRTRWNRSMSQKGTRRMLSGIGQTPMSSRVRNSWIK
jgi:hypothetical protein